MRRLAPSTHPPLQVQASAIMAQAPYIRGLLRAMRVPEQDHDDVIQDVVATVWHRVSEGCFRPEPKLKLEASIRKWLYGITWRQVSHYRQRVHRWREMPAGDPFGGSVECKWIAEAATPDDAYAASEILKALDRIPAKFSVVLVLRFFEGFDVIELGELLHGREKKRLGRERGSGATPGPAAGASRDDPRMPLPVPARIRFDKLTIACNFFACFPSSRPLLTSR